MKSYFDIIKNVSYIIKREINAIRYNRIPLTSIKFHISEKYSRYFVKQY